ncbi:MAG: RNA-guided pseudouridylation complex pseudouridine synthase subunit Cbf5 [Candidatus Diapherotrites archaeon]|nr:RNA-guided pseudouridylation complex pseudouridine synthase subunit Cbf5 [Candidatus Diapherotrites archaeon]
MTLIETNNLKSGFVILDKPSGPSSHEVTAWVKKVVGNGKAGHSGTLDPKVTGVLVIAIGKAVKLLRVFQKSDKEYICIARFTPMPKEDLIKKVFKQFVGKIQQMPPKEAAVRRKLRERQIYELKILEIQDNLVLFKVRCQHGTYIRVLVRDIARKLGVNGEMLELRRTRAGVFSEKEAITLQELVDFVSSGRLKEAIKTPLEALRHLKRITLKETAVSAICHGADLAKPGIQSFDHDITKGETIVLVTPSEELVGLAEAVKDGTEISDSKSGIVADTLCIVMDKDRYPKAWSKR